jgi:hypothetical protein
MLDTQMGKNQSSVDVLEYYQGQDLGFQIQFSTGMAFPFIVSPQPVDHFCLIFQP